MTQPDGAHVLSAVRSAYAACASYQDRGEIVGVIIHETPRPSRRTTIQEFSTHFVRPNRFRFEFAEKTVGPPEEWSRHLTLERDGVARGWWTVTGEIEQAELSLLLAGATGISHGCAHRVPPLLMPDRFRRGEEPVPEVVGEEVVGGHVCHKLRLSWPARSDCPVRHEEHWWIGTKDFLIRKAFHAHELGGDEGREIKERGLKHLREAEARGDLGGRSAESLVSGLSEPFRAETTTHYSPVVNSPIPGEVFDFVPSGGGS